MFGQAEGVFKKLLSLREVVKRTENLYKKDKFDETDWLLTLYQIAFSRYQANLMK